MGGAMRYPLSAFSITRTIFVHAAAPVGRIHSCLDKLFARGIRPIRCLRHISMFHGIEINVIAMTREISLVAQRVLPKAPLPDATLAFADAAGRTLLASGHHLGEFRFNQAPARGEISIPRRQCPDAMQVFGEYNDCVHRKRMMIRDEPKRRSKRSELICEELRAAVGEVDRKEKTPAGNDVAPVVCHRRKIECRGAPMQSNRRVSPQGNSGHLTALRLGFFRRMGGAQRYPSSRRRAGTELALRRNHCRTSDPTSFAQAWKNRWVSAQYASTPTFRFHASRLSPTAKF